MKQRFTKPSWWNSLDEDNSEPSSEGQDFQTEDLYTKSFHYNFTDGHEYEDEYQEDFYTRRTRGESFKRIKNRIVAKELDPHAEIIKSLSAALQEKDSEAFLLKRQVEHLSSQVVQLERKLQEKLEKIASLSQIIIGLSSRNQKILRQLGINLDDEQEDVVSCLFVSKKAPKEVIEAAYKALCKIYHPDAGGSEEKMKEINEARDKLYRERGWL